MSVRVRFAPSPTGYLHVGGARTALYNWLLARRLGGVMILRIEDTDAARSTDESVRAIFESLGWLGLSWDEGPRVGGAHGPYFQSERRAMYREHADALIAAGHAYPCWCTPEELERRREQQAAAGLPPRYDGRCRTLDAETRARNLASGTPAAIRFALTPIGTTAWKDIVRDDVSFQNEVLDDFVLLRSDGLPTYNFACVADDHAMEITHVIRGDDHISNTPRQILLYRAFGWEPPVFAHVPMILGADGSRLSKRHGATSVAAYADLGYVPEALVNFLALLGWSFDGKQELFDLGELVEKFRLERVGANPAVFNVEKLEWMNGQHLKRMSDEERNRRVTGFLTARGHDLSVRDASFVPMLVHAIGDRLKTLADAESYGAFVLKPELETDPAAWDAVREKASVGTLLDLLAARLEALPDFGLEPLEKETRAVAAEGGVKAGDLIGSCRVALTGRKVSPGIFEVMVLLGREKTLARLRDAAGRWRAESPLAKV